MVGSENVQHRDDDKANRYDKECKSARQTPRRRIFVLLSYSW